MTSDIHLKDYVNCGYFVTQYADRPASWSVNVFPTHILSLADSIAPSVPLCYFSNPPPTSYALYGIAEERKPALQDWFDAQFRKTFGWPNVFYSLSDAQDFIQQFITYQEKTVLLSAAVHRKYLGSLLAPEIDGLERCGVGEAAARRESPLSGEVLGFDMLSYFYCSFESWQRYGFEEEILNALNIKPNQHGFINSLAEADRCDAYMKADYDISIHGHDLWQPWLILKHPTS